MYVPMLHQGFSSSSYVKEMLQKPINIYESSLEKALFLENNFAKEIDRSFQDFFEGLSAEIARKNAHCLLNILSIPNVLSTSLVRMFHCAVVSME